MPITLIPTTMSIFCLFQLVYLIALLVWVESNVEITGVSHSSCLVQVKIMWAQVRGPCSKYSHRLLTNTLSIRSRTKVA